MPSSVRRAAATLLFLLPTALAAQPRTGITAAEIDAHLRFLSSDLLEGRAPGTRGGRLAAEYLAAQLEAFGVEPGVNGSYFQRVPIDIVSTQATTVRAQATGKATATLRQPEDIVIWGGSATPQGSARGELVFVGYGATAPEYKWDDFKDVDVKGKVLLVLVNDPPAPASEPSLFGGVAMTYYGRWTYKFEEAERRGAAGMLIVHRTDQTGYPWQVVTGSNATEHRLLARDPKLPAPLGVRGWITDSAATALLRQAGLDFAALRAQAATRAFRPVATGITMDLSVASTRELGERRRRGARARSAAQPRVRRAHRALGPPRHRYGGEWRLDLQRRVRQRVRRGDDPGDRARLRGAAETEALAALRLRDGGGVGVTRLRLLRPEPDRAALADRGERERG
jgi:hypothetical protein